VSEKLPEVFPPLRIGALRLRELDPGQEGERLFALEGEDDELMGRECVCVTEEELIELQRLVELELNKSRGRCLLITRCGCRQTIEFAHKPEEICVELLPDHVDVKKAFGDWTRGPDVRVFRRTGETCDGLDVYREEG